jgi:hypothetical protein
MSIMTIMGASSANVRIRAGVSQLVPAAFALLILAFDVRLRGRIRRLD